MFIAKDYYQHARFVGKDIVGKTNTFVLKYKIEQIFTFLVPLGVPNPFSTKYFTALMFLKLF